MTGFPCIDEMLKGGIPAGQLICFAAHGRPDDGPKSSIELHVIKQAFDQGAKVICLNTEITDNDTRF